jgi:hypothetical protein
VLRRVASEIDSDLYQDSMFWKGYENVLAAAVPRRRNRVAWLAGMRVVAVLVGSFAVYQFALDIALRLEPYWPIAPLLDGVRFAVRALQTVPLIGAWLSTVAGVVGAVLWLAIGAAVASLIGLVPFEVFRAAWEARDRSERTRLLGATSFGWPRLEHEHDGMRHTVFTLGHGPIVILMHEIYGITPEVEQLARIIAGRGFTVWAPEFFGDVGRPMSGPYLASCFTQACVSREFTILATGKTSRIASWLRSLAGKARSTNRSGLRARGRNRHVFQRRLRAGHGT